MALLHGSHFYAWSSFRNVECLNLLLSSGADLRRRDKFGRQVHVQGAQGWRLVRENGGRRSVLPCTLLFHVWACSICPWVSHSYCNTFCRTPLHYAAANGSYQCAVTLVTAGAGVNEADCKGCSPLHYAAASDTYRRSGSYLASLQTLCLP